MIHSPTIGFTFKPPLNYITYLLPRYGADYMITSGIPEQSLIDLGKQFLRSDEIFIDVGAHIGTYTLNYSPHVKSVLAFEAQRLTYYGLCGNLYLNQKTNVTPFHLALGDKDDTVKLRIISPDGGGSSIVNLPTHNDPKAILAEESVNVTTLDSHWKNCLKDRIVNSTDRIGLIKIDVEGNEAAVIRGAESLIREHHPRLLFEAWPDDWYKEKKAELIHYVKELGYRVIPIAGYSQMFLAEI